MRRDGPGLLPELMALGSGEVLLVAAGWLEEILALRLKAARDCVIGSSVPHYRPGFTAISFRSKGSMLACQIHVDQRILLH